MYRKVRLGFLFARENAHPPLHSLPTATFTPAPAIPPLRRGGPPYAPGPPWSYMQVRELAPPPTPFLC